MTKNDPARRHVGAHSVRPIMASPFQGEAVERSEADEGAHGDNGRSFPLPPHPPFAPQMPPSPLWGEGRAAEGGGPYGGRRGLASALHRRAGVVAPYRGEGFGRDPNK